MRYVSVLLGVAMICCVAGVAVAAEGDTCPSDARNMFLVDVEAGLPFDELEAIYGGCRDELSFPDSKSMTITNTGSVWYEKMNSCGYHPQYENVFCDVELLRRWGYGGFPAGSMEYVLFCFDCDQNGSFDFQTTGSVHVTDDISGGPLSFYFNASAGTASAPPMCTANDGLNTNVRAILSWAYMPTGCWFQPIWGNQIDFTARRDP